MASIDGRITPRLPQGSKAEVIHKRLWIEQLIHALTVAAKWLIYALTVAGLRINGSTPNVLVLPVFKSLVVGAAPFVHNPIGLHTTGLHLLLNKILKS